MYRFGGGEGRTTRFVGPENSQGEWDQETVPDKGEVSYTKGGKKRPISSKKAPEERTNLSPRDIETRK